MENENLEIEVCSKCLSNSISSDPKKCLKCGNDTFETRKGIQPFIIYRDENGILKNAHKLRSPMIKEKLEMIISEWKSPEDSEDNYRKPEIIMDHVIIEILDYLETRDRLEEDYKSEVRKQLRSIISDLEDF